MLAQKKKEAVQKRDPVATSKALLQAAMTEFTTYGFEGGRVDRIAQMAGCNKQLVYHYFGSKTELYKLTLEEVYREIRESETQLHLEDLSPEKAMAKLVAFSFDYLADHPEFIALLNDENRMGAAHLKTSDNIAEMHSPLVKMIEETLNRGIKAGLFNDQFEPVNLYLSIAGLSFFYFSNHKTLSVIFKRDMTSKESIKARRQHVIDLVLSSLRP
ncbi:TetR family transcriptional regulator [Brucellaceae bacterium C25G]